MSNTPVTNKGFSLLEAILALTIIGIVFALTIPNFQKSLIRSKARAVLDEFSASTHLAKTFSESLNKPVGLSLNITSGRLIALDIVDYGSPSSSIPILESIYFDAQLPVSTNSLTKFVVFTPQGSVQQRRDNHALLPTANFGLDITHSDITGNITIYYQTGTHSLNSN